MSEDDVREESSAEGENDDAIRELVDYGEPAGPDFIGRIRRSIMRRQFASELTGFTWSMPFQVLLEYLRVLCSLLSGRDRQTGEGHE